MIILTPEEQALLLPEYERYCAFHARMQQRFPHLEPLMLSFDDWWRAKADNIKDNREGK